VKILCELIIIKEKGFFLWNIVYFPDRGTTDTDSALDDSRSCKL